MTSCVYDCVRAMTPYFLRVCVRVRVYVRVHVRGRCVRGCQCECVYMCVCVCVCASPSIVGECEMPISWRSLYLFVNLLSCFGHSPSSFNMCRRINM